MFMFSKIVNFVGNYFGLEESDKAIKEQIIIMELETKLKKFINAENLHRDKEFIDNILNDINSFTKAQSHNCVLLFPPLNSRRRYIIHNLVAEVYNSKLQTFSVGLCLRRRIVICSTTIKKRANVVEIKPEMDKKVESDKGAVSKKRTPRPAAPIYVPPAVRRKLPLNTTNGENYNHRIPCGTQIIDPKINENQCNTEKKSVNNNVEKVEIETSNICTKSKNDIVVKNVPEINVIKTSDIKVKDVCTKIDEPQVPEFSHSKKQNLITNNSSVKKNDNTDHKLLKKTPTNDVHKEKDKDQEHQELFRASEEINRKKRIIKQSFNTSDVLIISNDKNIQNVKRNDAKCKKNEEESLVDNWEDLADDRVESDIVIEIIEQVGKVNIHKAKEDYSEYAETRTIEGDFDHVLEIYDFPKQFQTRDLVTILEGNTNKSNTFHIKWVDDFHALAVFSSGFVANHMLLTVKHPLLKLRALTDASKQSITRAVKFPNAVLPSAVRPQTCPQTARRMVTGALGLRLGNAREERAKEIKILKEAREKKRLSAKQEEDAWLGNPKPSTE